MQFTGEDAAMCMDYMRRLNIPLPTLPALAGALILHHVTRRMKYDPEDAWAMEALRALLEKVVAWIEGARMAPES